MEKVKYLGQPNCYRLSNETVELVVTTDVGPRVVRYAFHGAENILGEVPDAVVESELGAWKPFGGHRLWAAPEAMPRSYAPDNDAVAYEFDGERSIRLTQQVEPATGIGKELTVTLDAEGTGVRLLHRLTNHNLWPIEVAPWALTIMHGGGEAIFPQEPYGAHPEHLLPARSLVLWRYTDLSDPRWTLGKRFIRLRTDESLSEPQKIGITNKQGWAAYHRRGTLFVKRAAYQEGATYPDCGSNFETFTAASFIEVETLAPLRRLEPGESAEHTEDWSLFSNVQIGTTEQSLSETLAPLIAHVTSSDG